MKITITIKNDDDFLQGFKKLHNQDFKIWLENILNKTYETGKTMIAKENAEPNIILQMVKVE